MWVRDKRRTASMANNMTPAMIGKQQVAKKKRTQRTEKT